MCLVSTPRVTSFLQQHGGSSSRSASAVGRVGAAQGSGKQLLIRGFEMAGKFCSSSPIFLLMRWQFFCTVIGAILVAYGGAWWTGLTSLDERIDSKFAQMDAKFVHMEEKWDTKFDRLEAFLHTTIRHFEEDKRHLDRQYFLARDECRHGCACSNNSS